MKRHSMMEPVFAIVFLVQIPNVRNYVAEVRLFTLVLLMPKIILLVAPIRALLLYRLHRMISLYLFFIARPSQTPVGNIAEDIFFVDQTLLNFEFLLVDSFLHV